MSIAKEWIDSLSSKVFIGEKLMYGVRGGEYKKNLYRIPKVKIGAMAFFSPIVQEESEEFLKDAVFLQNKEDSFPKREGSVGWELFYKTNLLVDIQHSRIAFCSSVETLKKEGYAVDNWIKTPLLLERGLVEFEARSPTGPLRCMLDTASTWNILNTEIEEGKSIDQVIWEKENLLSLPSFTIEGNDFGPLSFHRFPIKIPIHIEAILGMEFLENHTLFLDFTDKCAYFAPRN